jgi:CheY-like chemotaxis protein
LIEDDPLVMTAMRWALEDLGCSVRNAGSGAEALALVDVASPQLVIADYRLPGDQNGLEVIAAVRICAGKDLPACVITGELAQEVRMRAEQAGVRCLYKPIRPDDLRAWIEEACRSSDFSLK